MNTESITHEARTFTSPEAAIAWLQSLPDTPDSIIILTPPPAR
jgi:hypothetical protein